MRRLRLHTAGGALPVGLQTAREQLEMVEDQLGSTDIAGRCFAAYDALRRVDDASQEGDRS